MAECKKCNGPTEGFKCDDSYQNPQEGCLAIHRKIREENGKYYPASLR